MCGNSGRVCGKTLRKLRWVCGNCCGNTCRVCGKACGKQCGICQIPRFSRTQTCFPQRFPQTRPECPQIRFPHVFCRKRDMCSHNLFRKFSRNTTRLSTKAFGIFVRKAGTRLEPKSLRSLLGLALLILWKMHMSFQNPQSAKKNCSVRTPALWKPVLNLLRAEFWKTALCNTTCKQLLT